MIKTLFLSVFEVSLQVSLIALVFIVFSPLLNQRYAAKWKYFVWIALAFRLVLPFPISLPSQQLVLYVPTQMTAPIAANAEAGIPLQLLPKRNSPGIALFDIAAALWLIGCVLFFAIHLFSCLHYKRKLLQNGSPVHDGCILHQLLQLLKELHIRRSIPVIISSKAGSPMIIGFFRPVLVLPETEYSREEMYFILKHELIHWKRHDIWIKLLLVTANAVHWFNPVIYILKKEAAIDMELSCDEKVIEGAAYSVRKAYTETLFSTLHKQHKKTAALTTQFYGGTDIMKKRFIHILHRANRKNGFPVLACVIALSLLLGIVTGCSFTEPAATGAPPQTDAFAEFEETADSTPPVPAPAPELEADISTEETLSADEQEIKNASETFAAAYFSGDLDTVKSYLITPYDWDIDVYPGTGSLSEFTLKGLTDIGHKGIGSVQVVSLEFRDSDYPDMFFYLTLEFIKQEDGWKLQFYGIEG